MDTIEIKFRGMFEGGDKVIKAIQDTVAKIKEDIKKGTEGIGKTNIFSSIKEGAKNTGTEYQKLEAILNKLGTTSVESAAKVQILQRQLQLLKEEVKTNTGNALELDDAYRKKAASLKEVSKAVKEAESIFGRYGMNLKQIIKWQLEWYLGAGLIWGAFFKIRDAISEFIEYSQGLTDVGAITMATTEELKEMDKVVRQVATSSTMGFKAGTEALKTMGQAGMSATDSMKSLNTVAMLTTATGAGTNDIVKLITTSMNVWNISADKSTEIGNALAAAINYSKLEIGDLSVAFNYLAAQSRLMGYSLESTLAIVAQLAQMGVRASTIGTGLSQFMGSLLAPTKRFKEGLEKVGLSIKDLQDSSGRILPFVEVIRKLEKAGMDVATVFESLEKREARNLANALAAGADSFKNMEDAITGTNAMFVMFNKSMDGVKNRLIVLKNQTLELVFAFLGKLEPAIKGTIGVLSNFMTGFREVGPMIVGLTTAFSGWKVVAGIISAINKEMAIMAGMNALVAASNVQLSKMAVLWTLLSKHPFLLIATGIIALITAIGFLKNSLDTTKQAQDSYNKSMEKSMQVYQNVADINRYVSLLKNENVTYETKNGLLRKLQELMPDVISQHAVLKDVIKDLKDENSKLNGVIRERIDLYKQESIQAQIPGMQTIIDQYHELYLVQKDLLDLQKTAGASIDVRTGKPAKSLFNTDNLKKTNDELKKIQPQIDNITTAIAKSGENLYLYMGGLKIPQELSDTINLQADLLRMEEDKANRPPPKKPDTKAAEKLAALEAKLAEKRLQGVEKQLKAENDVNNTLEKQLGIGLSLIQIEEHKNREKILLSKESKKVKDIELELLNADIENKRQALFDKYISAKSKSIDDQSKEEIGDIKDKEKAENRAYNRSLKFIDLVIDEYAKLDDMIAVELKYKEKIAKIDEDTASRVKERKGIYEEDKTGIEKKLTALEQTEGLFKIEQKDKLLKELKDKEKDYNADVLVIQQKGIDDREIAIETGASKGKAITERLLNEKLATEKRLSKALKTERELDIQVADEVYNRGLDFYKILLHNKLISDTEYLDKKRDLLLEHERVTKNTAYKERDYSRKTNQQAMQDADTYDEYMKAKLESMKNTTYDTWEDIGNATESAFKNMSDTVSDIFFDGMKGELKSLGDYFKRFSDYVMKLLTDMAAKWLIFGTGGKVTGGGGLVGLVGDLLRGIGGSEVGGGGTQMVGGSNVSPGFMTKYSKGGILQGKGGDKDDQNIARLSNKEYIINAESTGQFKPILDVINFGTQGVKDKLKDFLGLMSGSADFKVQRATDFEFAGAGHGIGSMSIYVPIRADMSNKSKSGLRGDMESEIEHTVKKVLKKYI